MIIPDPDPGKTFRIRPDPDPQPCIEVSPFSRIKQKPQTRLLERLNVALSWGFTLEEEEGIKRKRKKFVNPPNTYVNS